MNYPRQRIALGDLNVDLGNFRIEEVDSSRDAYKKMIEEEGVNLINLADDIVNNGLSPAEPLIVGRDPDNKRQYIVFEGNRRVTALKLLQAPALATGTQVHAAFVKLGKRFAQNPITDVESVIFPDKDSALLWIERKHTYLGGRGISQWGSPAKHRFEVHRKGVHRPSMAVIDHLDGAGALPQSVRKELLQRTTNVDRVLQMPYFQATLGVSIGDDGQVSFGNGDSKAGNALLMDILRQLADKKFSVDKIKTKEQRKEFIDSYADRSVAAPPAQPASKKRGSAKTATDKATKKAKAKPSDADHRITLAPHDRGTTFLISDPRLEELYKEARKLSADQFPAISAVLVRVFLELSTDYFLKSFKVARPSNHKSKNWIDSSISLKEKITAALKVIDPTGKSPDLKLARQGLSDTGRMHAIEELHTFVHGLSATIVGKEVRIIWDRWHNYLALLHKSLSDAGH